MKSIAWLSAVCSSSALVVAALAQSPDLGERDTATSGPIFGDDGVAKCDDLMCKSGADWLCAAMCAVAKCKHDWLEDTISIVSGTKNDTSIVGVTIYLSDSSSASTQVKYADAVGDTKDNNGNAWFAGAIDQAVIALLADGVKNGKLLTNADSDATWQGAAGLYSLLYLTGMNAVSQSLPSTNGDVWPLVQKVNGSPVLVRTAADSTALTASQYYSVNTYTGTSADDAKITLWDPMATDSSKAYVTVSIDDFRKSVDVLYHLDWPHFFAQGKSR